ncbi:hypothetical protein [Streptomyces bingchenggensis]|uniref:hypothetical protein n=1 Tax=Streptomyces bingchenggensis TaxID=379067 RepID=UPI0011D221D3|nr:hypothetical protein [Streptomyces bingchenggensis]
MAIARLASPPSGSTTGTDLAVDLDAPSLHGQQGDTAMRSWTYPPAGLPRRACRAARVRRPDSGA